MLAIVPSVTAAAATGLTTLRPPLFAMAGTLPGEPGDDPGPRRDVIWGLQRLPTAGGRADGQTVARTDRSSM